MFKIIPFEKIIARTEFIHKKLGLYSGVLLAIILFALAKYCDFIIQNKYKLLDNDAYEKVLYISNSFSSILIAILLTTFSVVFVVMQLASTQFSPRILRYFMSNDLKIQFFIGAFLCAIALVYFTQITCALFYNTQFTICIFVTIIMSLFCVLYSFPQIVIHLNDNMNVATITNKIKEEVINEIEILYEEKWQINDNLLYKRTSRNRSNQAIFIFWNESSGYLSEVNYDKLYKLYNKFFDENSDIPKPTIYQKPIVGEFVMSKATVALILEFEENIKEEAKHKILKVSSKIVEDTFFVYKFRSYKQDINFGVRKLVDIAIKAISPAVNDPTTCINCIDYLGEIVRRLAMRKFPSTRSNELRNEKIFVSEFNFKELVNFAFDQIYQWGKKDPVIVKRLLRTIIQIVPCVENPYNLMVLIKEVEDMKVDKIYALNSELSEHTTEQITSVLNDVKDFKKVAVYQIEAIKEKFFVLYGENSVRDSQKISNSIREEEKKCIVYLTEYLRDNT
jgi:uncharacterized membrane protein